MDPLDRLEADSIHLLREARRAFERLGMLWSFGKDSMVCLHLARKAFVGRIPLPVIHIDTGYEPAQMYAFRDQIAIQWGLDLIVGRNDAARAGGMAPDAGRVVCCTALKSEALKQTIAAHGFTGIIAGIRRDEEGTRAKERLFSPRAADGTWDVKNQPPELWDQVMTRPPPGGHIRVHPILAWSELDVWRYIKREAIPLVSLYFARDGRRYRSLGCAPCTGTIASSADSIDAIIAELETTRIAERAGRAQDQEAEDSFERLRAHGHM